MFSIIIAAYNDWGPLDQCLQSVAAQIPGPDFEVILVDDGSEEPAPEFILRWTRHYPLTIVRQSHTGIPGARNRGVKLSKGPVLLFVDADCRLEANCLTALCSAISRNPEYNCFQLRLTGECTTLVGRAEQLRLLTLQQHFLQPDGCIRYLNTSGFAIRRTAVSHHEELFDSTALRGEDTLLLTTLMQGGDLPFFTPDAVVRHSISLTLGQCLHKDIRSAYQERKTFDIIGSKQLKKIQLNNKERLRLLLAMWRTSGRRSIGRPAWFVLVTREALERIVILASGCLPRGS